ncbi:ketopantoate hydroxymethyltransferase [Armillaria nabsnona]|nr:ketopantoate hydroxymethyltransferase [Armillaria nabsnona]
MSLSSWTFHRSAQRALGWMQRRCMSVRPAESDDKMKNHPRKKVTIQTLQTLKSANIPITMLTAYDYPTAVSASSNTLIDITLVGDSLAQVCLGYTSTSQLTLEEMIHHSRAVARGTTHPLLIADMPFGSFHISVDNAVENAIRLIREAQVEAVKLEGGEEIVPVVRQLTRIGIPVMAHVGLWPQRHVAMSGYKVQGRSAVGAKRVINDALALEDAGAFAVLVEAVPKELGKHLTEKLQIPTIGIGAGPWTSGQVLVWDDVMGTWCGHKAKFVRRFADLKTHRDKGVQDYAQAVRERTFPSDTESYTMDPSELAKLSD